MRREIKPINWNNKRKYFSKSTEKIKNNKVNKIKLK